MFLKKFHGKFIQVITKLSIMTDQGNAPLIESGYVVDVDDTFLYLGSANPLEVTKCINLEDVAVVDTEMPDETDMMIGGEPNEDNEGLN